MKQAIIRAVYGSAGFAPEPGTKLAAITELHEALLRTEDSYSYALIPRWVVEALYTELTGKLAP